MVQKVLFSDESKFCISFGNQGLEEEWRDTESKLLEVQCEVSKVSDDLGVVTSVGPLCFIKSKVNAAVYQEIQQSRRAEGSIVPQQCHRLIASMPHLTDAGVCAKGAPTNY